MFAVQPTNISDGVIVKIQGDITERDAWLIHGLLQLKSNAGDEVNALIDFDEWQGTSFRELIENINLAQFSNSLNKVAFVANSNWIEPDANLNHFLPGVHAKHFQPSEKEEAKDWLAA